jgi:hypothetical protein
MMIMFNHKVIVKYTYMKYLLYLMILIDNKIVVKSNKVHLRAWVNILELESLNSSIPFDFFYICLV